MICPNCGRFMTYVGIEDGFGTRGEKICETWECEHCGEDTIENCTDEYGAGDEHEHFPQDEGNECEMCGEPNCYNGRTMCPSCKQVWDG